MITEKDILSMQSVLPTIAAKYIKETHSFIRLGLQQNRLPIGSAVQNPSGKWSYHISPGLLVAYQKGTLNIEMKPEANEKIDRLSKLQFLAEEG